MPPDPERDTIASTPAPFCSRARSEMFADVKVGGAADNCAKRPFTSKIPTAISRITCLIVFQAVKAVFS